jgi:hypothetical protein
MENDFRRWMRLVEAQTKSYYHGSAKPLAYDLVLRPEGTYVQLRRWMRLVESETTTTYLASLVNGDQKDRSDYAAFIKANGGDWDQGAKLYAAKHNRSPDDIFGEKARNAAFITKARGFDFSTFSEQGWDNFWLICQHCDFDRAFQKWALVAIQKHQGTAHSHYKYLYDRISCGLSGRQKYGTQDICDRDSQA